MGPHRAICEAIGTREFGGERETFFGTGEDTLLAEGALGFLERCPPSRLWALRRGFENRHRCRARCCFNNADHKLRKIFYRK